MEKDIKPPIDTSVFNKWQSVASPAISNDGHYALYTINNQPAGNKTLVLKNISGNCIMEFPGIGNASFTADSHKAIFIRPKDTLCLLTLSNSSPEYILHVSSFRFFQRNNEEWLAYLMNSPLGELVFRNLSTGYQQSFSGVINYLISNNANTLLLQKNVEKDKAVSELLNFTDSSIIMIWRGSNVSGFAFDDSGSQLAFIVDSNISSIITEKGKSIWYYKRGMKEPLMLANNRSQGIDSGFIIDRIYHTAFSGDGSRLFFTLKEKTRPLPKPDVVKVDIWSYTDEKLQSQQLNELSLQSYLSVINISDQRIIRLQDENEIVELREKIDLGSVIFSKGGHSETNWNLSARLLFYLVSLKTHERKKMKMRVSDISPMAKYAICQDSLNKDFYSYDIESGLMRNITKGLPIPVVDVGYYGPDSKGRELSIAGWLNNDTALLVYDHYDIWQVDPAGKVEPINLTNGYGRKHKIILRLAENYQNKTISEKKKIILSAFNQINKNNGFYQIVINKREDPERLTMGPYIYHMPGLIGLRTFYPIKARDANIYIVRRENASQAANYFITNDFRSFTALTEVYSEKAYNWLKTELVAIKTLNGRILQGILYKPENFDPQKKYPVIINYYEKESHKLNRYETPDYSYDNINIPWFVSNGYIVLAPDIYYTTGKTGEGALNAVISSFKFLSKIPWVNTMRIGLQGHSFGGYETNYIITHTTMFAAAMSSSGMADLISDFGSLWGAGFSKQEINEFGQSRMGSTPWRKPYVYIENSPIFWVDKVITPLLMMNNKEDGAVSFAQGVEFFTALRRLGKKVWMLQYDGEAHSLLIDNARKDYTIRMTQFFDHYLKDKEAPKWMTQGVSAKKKGVDFGLELDHTIKTPGPSLLIAPSGK